MKSLLLLGLGLALSLHAQVPSAEPSSPPPAVPASPATSSTVAPVLRNAADLEKLLGPIALYPDALIGLILPASTTPADIVFAARNLGPNTTAESVAGQPWDDSVKALVHYPDLLRWLDQNLTWTQALGAAFAEQPADVMNAVQRLRQQARAAGTLVDTPQQQVVTRDNALVIVPAQPDVIYVPVYDPAVVYVSSPVLVRHTRIHFYSAYRTGPWLCYTPDWHHGYLHVGYQRHHHPSGHVYVHPHSTPSSHVWSPRPTRPRIHDHPNRPSVSRFDRPSSVPPTHLNPRPPVRTPRAPDRPFSAPPSGPFSQPRGSTLQQEQRERVLPSREPTAPLTPFQRESLRPRSR